MGSLCRDKNHYSRTVHHCSRTVHVLKNIKNRSHGTIHTFKSYIFYYSTFSFQFSVSATISSIQTDLMSQLEILRLRLDCVFGQRFSAYVFLLLLFFSFFFFNWEQCFHIGCCLSVGPMHCAWTHYLSDQQILHWNVSVSGSHALFTGPTNLFFHTKFH